MLFFSLGIWLYKYNYPIERKPEWYSRYLSWLCFIGFNVIRTFMAFEFEAYTRLTIIALVALHILSVAAGVIAVWYSADNVVKWFMKKKWFVWATGFSFIIYGLHIPLLAYTMRLASYYGSGIPNYRFVFYLVVPIFILLFCIAVGAIFRRAWPWAYKLSTGGRGF